MVSYQQRVFVIGGYLKDGNLTRAVWSSTNGLCWQLDTPLPAKRPDANAIVFAGALVVLNGQSVPWGLGPQRADVQLYPGSFPRFFSVSIFLKQILAFFSKLSE